MANKISSRPARLSVSPVGLGSGRMTEFVLSLTPQEMADLSTRPLAKDEQLGELVARFLEDEIVRIIGLHMLCTYTLTEVSDSFRIIDTGTFTTGE
jgi:hypothetical protein